MSRYSILITRYAPQTNIGKQIRVIASELAEAANTKVYQTAIRQTVAVSESISAQQGIVLYSPTSTAAQDYRSFMREIKREELSKGGLAHGGKDSGLSEKHRSNVSEHER